MGTLRYFLQLEATNYICVHCFRGGMTSRGSYRVVVLSVLGRGHKRFWLAASVMVLQEKRGSVFSELTFY